MECLATQANVKIWRSKREATAISIHLLWWNQAVKKLRFWAAPSNVTANFQCTWRTNLLKLTNPYISLESCAEGYNQSEIDPLFNIIVLPNINYALSVHAASESDLTPLKCFLDRCFKRKYTSKPVGVYDFLERQDHKIFRKVSNAKGHPLLSIMPRVKPSSYNLRKETCFKSKINTMRFKNSFINRLVLN